MKTLNSEYELFGAFSDWIKKDHQNLEIQIPASGSAPSPDFYISNKQTGKGIGIELKAGTRVLPLGIYPSLKTMQEQMKQQNKSFVLLSTAPLSDALSSNVEASGIPFYKITDAAGAIEAITPMIREIEERPINR